MAAGYSRNTDAAEAFRHELEEHAVPASVHRGNIGSPEDCRRVVDEVIAEHGRIDILVNNAGITIDKTALKLTDDDWRKVLDVNLSGAFFMSRGAEADARARHRAHREHLVGLRLDREHRAGQLRGVQVRPVRPHLHAGQGGRVHAQACRQARRVGAGDHPARRPPAPRRRRAGARPLRGRAADQRDGADERAGRHPAALKHAFDTGGVSLLRGVRNLVRDVLRNGGMPAQVDERPFELGRNLAATPGAVVHREEICEVIQYAPATARVRERPLLMFPPEINKHYFVDLAPGRSFVEWAVAQGVQYFTIVWRNPREEHGHWDMDDYLGATLRATDVVREITGTDDLNRSGCAPAA